MSKTKPFIDGLALTMPFHEMEDEVQEFGHYLMRETKAALLEIDAAVRTAKGSAATTGSAFRIDTGLDGDNTTPPTGPTMSIGDGHRIRTGTDTPDIAPISTKPMDVDTTYEVAVGGSSEGIPAQPKASFAMEIKRWFIASISLDPTNPQISGVFLPPALRKSTQKSALPMGHYDLAGAIAGLDEVRARKHTAKSLDTDKKETQRSARLRSVAKQLGGVFS